MKKSTWKVFTLIMVVVAAFIAWQILFKDGGLVRVGYTAIQGFVNEQWQRLTGSSSKLMADWGGGSSDEVKVETDGNADTVGGETIQ